MSQHDQMNRSRFALGTLFLGALGLQVTNKEFFARLIPSYLRKYETQVAVGTRGLLGVTGLAFLVPRLRVLARVGALGVLLPSLPEAVNQVRQPDRMREAGVPPQVAIARIPVQLAVIALVLRSTRRPS